EHASHRASAVKSAVSEAVRNAAEKLREDAQEMDRLDAELSRVTAERDVLLADRASRGTEREAGRREAFAQAAKFLRETAYAAKERLGVNDSPSLCEAVENRADERRWCASDIDALAATPATPSQGEMVRREDVVEQVARWLEQRYDWR